MLTTLILASATAATPSDVEAWLPRLEAAVDRHDHPWLREVFAELLARSPGLEGPELRRHLKREMTGEREVECRDVLCRVRWVRDDDHSELVVRRVGSSWQLWDPEYRDHVAGPVSARLAVEGEGEVEVRVNGMPTFLFDPVRDTASAVIDRHLSPGINLVTVVPRGAVSLSLAIERDGRSLVTHRGVLDAVRTFTFEVPAGSRPVP